MFCSSPVIAIDIFWLNGAPTTGSGTLPLAMLSACCCLRFSLFTRYCSMNLSRLNWLLSVATVDAAAVAIDTWLPSAEEDPLPLPLPEPLPVPLRPLPPLPLPPLPLALPLPDFPDFCSVACFASAAANAELVMVEVRSLMISIICS